MLKTTRFDAADYLDTPEARAEYMTAALETGDVDFIRDAVGVVARARHDKDRERNRVEPRKSLQGAWRNRQSRVRDRHAYCPRLGS